MYNVFAITLHYVFKATPPFADTSIGQGMLVTIVATQRLIALLILHRLETSAVVNHLLKRSPNSIFHRIQIWVDGGYSVMFGLMNGIFTLIAHYTVLLSL